ncbi:MAG: thiamine pyrophosphate-dependent enzyme, partial [bacterium]
SEIGNIFSDNARDLGVYFEFSTNERAAMEAAIGASFSGLKCLVAMKSFGMNICSDPLFPFLYTGCRGPVVIAVGDDPGCWSSAESEENSRGYSGFMHLPTIEPADPEEMKEFIKIAFTVSEKYKLPVMVRFTTRVAHQKMIVKLGEISKEETVKVGFIKDPDRYVTMPPRVLEMKKELFIKIEKIRQWAETSKINAVKKQFNGKKNKMYRGVGIITSGIGYLYTIEALKDLHIDIDVLKLGSFYPLPENKIKSFIKGRKKLLVVEELDPYVEKEVERLAKNINPRLQIFGKNVLSEIGEMKPEMVTNAINRLIGKVYHLSIVEDSKLKIKRYPDFCPGCFYRLVFNAVKKVAPKDVVYGGDIGCYMIGSLPTYGLADYLSAMGSSIGIAHGIRKAANTSFSQASESKRRLISFIGDSTFFHSGIPSLINTVFNKSNPLIIILDNQTTGMTGHQTNPGLGRTGSGEETTVIDIESIVKACGVKNVRVVDPINMRDLETTIKDFLGKEDVSVIIAKRVCWLLSKSKKA